MYNSRNNGDLISRADVIISSIKFMNPDIILLQEASEYFLEEILENTDYVRHVHTLTHGGICVTLTKPSVNVSEVNTHNGSVSIVVDDVVIYNCHLTPYANNHKMRLIQITPFFTKNVIIMGDMNMNDTQNIDHPTIKDLGVCDRVDTWNLSFFENGSTVRRRYDRVFTDIDFKSFYVHEERHGHSDHLPISLIF